MLHCYQLDRRVLSWFYQQTHCLFPLARCGPISGLDSVDPDHTVYFEQHYLTKNAALEYADPG